MTGAATVERKCFKAQQWCPGLFLGTLFNGSSSGHHMKVSWGSQSTHTGTMWELHGGHTSIT